MVIGVLILNGQKAQFAHEAVAADLVACLVNDSVWVHMAEDVHVSEVVKK